MHRTRNAFRVRLPVRKTKLSLIEFVKKTHSTPTFQLLNMNRKSKKKESKTHT